MKRKLQGQLEITFKPKLAEAAATLMPQQFKHAIIEAWENCPNRLKGELSEGDRTELSSLLFAVKSSRSRLATERRPEALQMAVEVNAGLESLLDNFLTELQSRMI